MPLKLCEPPKTEIKVLTFEREPDEWEKSMLELIEQNRRGELVNFVGMWTLKDAPRSLISNWWGESCLFCLGMASRMAEEINRWMNGEVEE